MKKNFFERNKKKSASALLLLFLKGRGKYFLILFLALFASAPLVVTSDAFKAFTNHPAVAAVIRSLGLGGYQFNDSDMLAQAAHNSGGKKSSYWQKYFKAINSPLPTGKFTSMKYLKGDISDLGPVKISDKKKNKYGIKGVANEENAGNENPAVQSGVDLSGLMAAARSGATDYDGEATLSDSATMELGVNSAFGPFVGQKTVMSRGGAINKKDALANNISKNFASRVPKASSSNGNPRSGKKAGRPSSFAWNKMARSKRAGAFNPDAKKGRTPSMTKMIEAYAYSRSATESDMVATIDTLAGAPFDGNPVEESVLDTGEPISMPSGSSYANYVSEGIKVGDDVTECGRALQNASKETVDEMEENSATYNDLGSRPSCSWRKKSARRRYNNKLEKIRKNCVTIEETFNKANTEKCKGEYPKMDLECHQYEDMKVHCSFWQSFGASFLDLVGASIFGGLLMLTILSAIFPSLGEWYDKYIGGFINTLTGNEGKDADDPDKMIEEQQNKTVEKIRQEYGDEAAEEYKKHLNEAKNSNNSDGSPDGK